MPNFAMLRSGLQNAAQTLLYQGAAHSMHALLGDISFKLINCFEGAESKFGGNYAEHALIEGKARLQWMGEKLKEINWSLMFHQGFCDPERELLKLKLAIASHQALPLIFANGDYQGWFVPTELDVTTRQTTASGTLVWIEAKLALREYLAPKMLSEQTPKKLPSAAEQSGGNGSVQQPPNTVRKTPPARSTTSSVCRN